MKFLEELKELTGKGMDFAKKYGPSKKEFLIAIIWLYAFAFLFEGVDWAREIYKKEIGEAYIYREYDPSFMSYYLALTIRILLICILLWAIMHRLKVKQIIFEEKKSVVLKDSKLKDYFKVWWRQSKLYATNFCEVLKDFVVKFFEAIGWIMKVSAISGFFAGGIAESALDDKRAGMVAFIAILITPIAFIGMGYYLLFCLGRQFLTYMVEYPPFSFQKLVIELDFTWPTIIIMFIINFVFNLYIKTKSGKISHSFWIGPVIFIASIAIPGFILYSLSNLTSYLSKINANLDGIIAIFIFVPIFVFLFLTIDNYRYHRWTDDVN